jgi:hypothetical protein
MLEADAQIRSRAAGDSDALDNLLATTVRVNQNLNLQPLETGARQ